MILNKNQVNILIITGGRIFENKGGVDRVTATLAKEFIKMGYYVAYFALVSGKDENIDGVEQYYFPMNVKLSSCKKITYLKRLVESLKIDIVINQKGTYRQPFKIIRKALHKKAKLITVHHNCIACLSLNLKNILSENLKHSWYFKLINHQVGWWILKYYNRFKYKNNFKHAIEYSDQFVLLSKKFQYELESFIGPYDSTKVTYISNPLPFDILGNVERKKRNVLLFVGHLNYQQKRADLLIEIWQRLYQTFPDWSMEVIGDGVIKEELIAKAKNKEIDRITFHGQGDPREILEKAKLFCMTSSFEGFGMVLVEAQAYGCVPFAFNTFAALTDIIEPGKNGYIISPYNIEQYVEDLSSLMRNESRRKEMAINAQKSVAKFNSGVIAGKWIELFEKLSEIEY